MVNLVVVVMGQSCQKFLPMCLSSIKEADKIIYCDGGSIDESCQLAKQAGAVVITNKYDQQDKGMNGKQRNFYLDYLKENFPDDWALCLDADEVVEDLSKIKKFIQDRRGVYSVKMRHFISDLGHEDSTVKEHFVPNRLFKISDVGKYGEVEHPVLVPKNNRVLTGNTAVTTIWHLAYVPNMWEIKKRYDNHLAKSNMHTPEYLRNWYYAHLFGQYPKTSIDLRDIPEVILKTFGIDKDEFYFANRGLEAKHFIDASHWKAYFNCQNVIEWGCGRGPRVMAMATIGFNAKGYELSKWAVEHSIVPIVHGDITAQHDFNEREIADLSIAYDVLEHINYKDLPKAIDNLKNSTKKDILISVPVIGDPNLENDKTHIIKETKEWWIEQFTNRGCKHIPTPNWFQYKEQILIFEKIS